MSAFIRAAIESPTPRLRQQERKTGAPTEKTREPAIPMMNVGRPISANNREYLGQACLPTGKAFERNKGLPMNPTRFVLAFTGIAVVAGCSTLTMGTSQEITVLTPGADHATCTVASEQPGEVLATLTTPGVVRVSRSRKDVQLSCQKQRYRAATVTLQSKFATVSKVQLPLGYLVDGISGALWEYPSKVLVAMTLKSASASASVEDSPPENSN
jgi:hypothetical protein